MTTPRFVIELDQQTFERLGERALTERRTLKAEAAVLLEAALQDCTDRSPHLELVAAGRPPGAA